MPKGRISRLGILLSTVTALRPFKTPGNTSLLSPDFNAFVEGLRTNGSVPGVSLGVVRLGEGNEPVMQLASWGQKTEDGDGHDLTPDTLFGLASCSKAFLATSLGILMDDFAQGKNMTPLPPGLTRFDWDTKVSDLLPDSLGWGLDDLGGDQWATHKASIKDVLGHVSGLLRHDYAYAVGDTESDECAPFARRTSCGRSGRTTIRCTYMLGAYLVSLYAPVPYTEFVVSRIFEPLGMSSTTFWPSIARRSRKLTDTWTKHGRRIPFWFDDEVVALNAGPGGVISNAEDAVKWLAVWLNKGIGPMSGARIFPENVYHAVTTSHHVALGSPERYYGAGIVGYGIGWQRWGCGDVEVVAHTGGIPGFSTMIAFSPSSNMGIAILLNADEKGTELFTILEHTFDTVLGTQLSRVGMISAVTDAERPRDQGQLVVSPPTLHMGTYKGLYNAEGYRPFAFCSAQDTSRYCSDVISDFATIDPPSTLNISLYGTFESIWATHVRLQHFSGDVYNVTFTALFPKGYGKNASAFASEETGTSSGWVEFVVATTL